MMFYASSRKSKTKLKPKAEREEYAEWLRKHKVGEYAKRKSAETLDYKLSTPPGRETVRHPSLNTGLGVATKAEPKVYTGTKVMGIATLHKSNAVPVFNSEEAVDISRMRR
jgi:hypothetical protein